MKWLIIFSMLISSTIVFSQSVFAESHIKIESTSIYNLDSSWTSQENKKIKLSKFLGKPTVLAMIYTGCQAACPLIVADMKKIENSLGKKNKDKVNFTIVSFDSENDTPQELKNFAKLHTLNLSYWTLLTATPDAIRELASVLNVQYKKNDDGSFSHSNVITLIDENGNIAYQQTGLGLDSKELVDKLLKILKSKTK